MDFFRAFNVDVLPSGNQNSLFEERETQIHHSPYQWEQLLIGYIRDGNVPMVERFFREAHQGGTKIGKLSDSELRQTQYLAVGFTYIACRAAIQGGMFEADAYQKSDAFIQKIDKQTSPQSVIALTQEAILDWVKTVHAVRTRQGLSLPIRACMEYMYEHLHSQVSLNELSKLTGLTGPYLSTLFKKEVGENISKYLLRLKIRSAQEMLLNTQYTTKDIGFYLNFSSQSYFIRCFKRITGVTPREFRQKGFASINPGTKISAID